MRKRNLKVSALGNGCSSAFIAGAMCGVLEPQHEIHIAVLCGSGNHIVGPRGERAAISKDGFQKVRMSL